MEAEVGEREKFDDVILLALQMEEWTTNQGMWVASKTWRRQENRFSPRTSGTNKASQTLDFNPV